MVRADDLTVTDVTRSW